MNYDIYSVWQGECGHLWRKVQSEGCPLCKAEAALAAQKMATEYTTEEWRRMVDERDAAEAALAECQEELDGAREMERQALIQQGIHEGRAIELREALQWARDRLVYVYNENPNYDFIQMMDRAIGGYYE